MLLVELHALANLLPIHHVLKSHLINECVTHLCIFYDSNETQAEARAEFAERSVQKLQKEVDRLEGTMSFLFSYTLISFQFCSPRVRLSSIHIHAEQCFKPFIIEVIYGFPTP